MAALLTGLHHVTALAGDPIRNNAFYTGVLGMRLVKRTVNFDDPLTYHLYFGDEVGSPGSLVTHFPHSNAKRGVHGSPEILETLLAIPSGTTDEWQKRLESEGVAAARGERGDGPRLAFEDHDGMRFGLVERSDVPSGGGITRVAGAVIHTPEVDALGACLTDVLGFEPMAGQAAGYRVGDGSFVEIVEAEADGRTSMGAGTVHHVAWRVPDDATQAEVGERLRSAGIATTPVMDRQYFRSIYCRVPGGVIFEIATDGPGFTVDESKATLGEALKLPPQYERRREEIENHLLPLR